LLIRAGGLTQYSTMNWEEFIKQPWLIKTVYTVVTIVLALVVNAILIRAFDAMEPKVPIPKMLFVILRKVIRYVVICFAFFLILNHWGFAANTVLAILGTAVGMVAIGFVAVWSLLSNLLCAFVLTAFRPFRIGDELELPGESVSGKAVDLNLLFVTLETPEGDQYRVPNNFFFQKIFKCRRGVKTVSLDEQLMREEPAQA